MTDYGHDLSFGTFLTPQNQRPQDVVDLARLSEDVGLDLVTFQDHPYQPGFLDTWTLLSWVAAQTSRIHVAANVVNLPLRTPAVLARAAASLDLLSGGRLELGLGAGGFADAVAAMGGPRRTAGEARKALDEAIDVIRSIWDTTERGGVRVDGEHYHVHGAKRGPEPAHDIAIWVGAYGPRMLQLVGRKADGWLPTLAYLKDGDLERGNRIIDAAATDAGRDPRAIRRLLNIGGEFGDVDRGFLQGPPEQWVEQLLQLVLEQGISSFILASDDPRAIAIFGEEVTPALREEVARERAARGTPAGAVIRDPKALALRHDDLDYDAVPPSLARTAVEPGDRGYAKVRSNFWYAGSPGLVLRPETPEQVAEALEYVRKQDVPLAVRSGGHAVTGNSTADRGVVLDLGRLNDVTVLESGLVRVGPGARWVEVARTLAPHGLAISSGDAGDVGVGGLATAGGIGFLARKYGLTIDHLVAAEVVLADGRLVRTDATHHPDLFWAVRGAGGNVGIVTAFEFRAEEVDEVIQSQMVFDGTELDQLLQRWGDVVENAPRELNSFLYASAQRGGAPFVHLTSVYAGSDEAAAVEALTPLLGVGPVLDQQAVRAPYAAILPSAGGAAAHSGAPVRPVVGSGLAVHMSPELSERIAEGLRTGASRWLSIRAAGGAVNDVDPQATAYAHRHQNFAIADIGSRREEFQRYWDGLRPHLDGLYINFETDTRPERLHDAFPGETLTRLRRIKAQYDPENVFDQNFPIPAAVDGEPASA